ncbi:sorting nexin-20 [Homalodisca vitripennis]|uniref:sorting nexin-20 n=1 Tax=Homalodisca vitripennis TaxID=197043 RepID=UPI001EEBA764|nr:sorting nexin-20 [Homalodisca vitripennis]XP_046675235.1 sorting nexin-20 [Homalodisca vitripennis]
MLPEESPEDLPAATENGEYVIPELEFKIPSAHITLSPKKHVTYTITIVKEGSSPDSHPSVIERRYTEFLELYTGLHQEFPTIMANYNFPKKVVLGNFKNETIDMRKCGFEVLLSVVAQNEKIRESSSVINFFLGKEQSEALKLISEKNYSAAIAPLEMIFRLLNKLFTNRHPLVLRALCLLVACCDAAGVVWTQKYAETAVTRYEAVSDADSLRYYVPLLQLCVRLLPGAEALQERLSSMKRRGMKVVGCPPLLDAVLADFPSTSGQT